MALKLNERYPGRFNNPTSGYPQGSFKNRTTPTSKDGSYLEKDWANDKEGFFQSLLSAAVVTANGAVDQVGASQYFDAMKSILSPGRLLRRTVLTTGSTVTLLSSTKALRILGVGGGGGGGGCAATGASQASAGSGGSSGSVGESWVTSSLPATLAVAVGSGGTGGAAGPNNGQPGGSTTIGSLMSVPGGIGGTGGVVGTPPGSNIGAVPGAAPTGANMVSSTGNSGGIGFSTSANSVAGGSGAPGPYGGGAPSTNGAGVTGSGPGAGGSGGARPQSNVAAAGGNGAGGIAIIEEWA